MTELIQFCLFWVAISGALSNMKSCWQPWAQETKPRTDSLAHTPKMLHLQHTWTSQDTKNIQDTTLPLPTLDSYSQNHRIIKAGRYLQDPQIQPLTEHPMPSRPSCRVQMFLEHSRDGDYTTSLSRHSKAQSPFL